MSGALTDKTRWVIRIGVALAELFGYICKYVCIHIYTRTYPFRVANWSTREIYEHQAACLTANHPRDLAQRSDLLPCLDSSINKARVYHDGTKPEAHRDSTYRRCRQNQWNFNVFPRAYVLLTRPWKISDQKFFLPNNFFLEEIALQEKFFLWKTW